MNSDRASSDQLCEAVLLAGKLLGHEHCWFHEGSYHLSFGDGWSLGFSPDDAGRIRIQSCYLLEARATVWVFANDDSRLAFVVGKLSATQEALAAV